MALTEKQIRLGVWYLDKGNDWPPDSITNIEEYKPSEKLNLVITQLSIKSSEQKKLVEAWCEKLPHLTEVKYLWFHSRVTQEMFDAACQMPNLEWLYVKWSGIKNIDALRQCKKLKHLHIGSSPGIESIEVLGEMKNLVTLCLENIKKTKDFSILSNLENLEGLDVIGSIWTTQKIDSLKFVEKLKNLKYLRVFSARVSDKSFDPLLKLPSLIKFDSSWTYPKKEFEKLKSIPTLKYGNVETSLKKE